MSSPPKHNKEAEENISKLKAILRELFQLDRGDLDFGLYRVMALKSAEVGDFLDKHLLPQVTEALGKIAAADSDAAQTDLDESIIMAEKLGGINPEDTDAVKDARARLAAARADEQAEAHTYNHLCTFFSRYYDQGDFMSLRRYKSAGREAYSIPYNGEEVKLHWANADQYYIKTTENYASYVFTVNKGGKECRVRFEITAADNEKDSIKENPGNSRRFILAKNFATERKDSLVIRFDHRPLTGPEKIKYPENGIKQQAAINADTEQRISKGIDPGWSQALAVPCPTEANGDRTLLGKHITAYTSKNSFDYFIHKDLGGFLRRELDYYLKSEVISVDNLELIDDSVVFMRTLAQVKAVKNIGNKIIDFLAQLEDFQKQLWLKKKFVLETQYCVTLDKVPESLYPEIAKNKAQQEEWVKLFAIDELKGGIGQTAYSKPLKPKFLHENLYLVLDTRHFDQGFKDKLLAALSEAGSIEEQMNGLLVHGENFQALNLLQERYREQVKCIYIDPPYNSKTSEIPYKNSYKHSSWLSMMENRLAESQPYQTTDGILVVAIDENEQEKLGILLSKIFPNADKTAVTIVHNPSGQQGDNFSYCHEFAYFIYPGMKRSINLENRGQKPDVRPLRDVSKGSHLREDAANCFYPIYIDSRGKIVGFGDVCQDSFHPPHANVEQKDGTTAIYPIDAKGDERKWVFARGSVEEIMDQLRAEFNKKRKIWDIIRTKTSFNYKTVWVEREYSANSYGSKLLNDILGQKGFDFPKSIHTVMECIMATQGQLSGNTTVLDYFAGSGTTGHAVINLNRDDGGDRKYILVEVGHHFENVLLPRLKKVTYSEEWKDGKPVNRDGISQLFKYIRLESYEDTLDSLEVSSRGDDWVTQAKNKEFIEDYQLRYALGEETAESASLMGKDFIDPFNYTLSVVRDGVRRDEKVDLAETFNFLLGLRLKSRRRIKGILAITGTNAKGENCLVLWRNLDEMNSNALNDWFTKHRKTFGNDLDLVYVNGDHTLNTLITPKDGWEAVTTELVFRTLMFGGKT